jgi:L-asparagine transporter-like permease
MRILHTRLCEAEKFLSVVLPSASFSARNSFLFLVIKAVKHLFTSVDEKVDTYKETFKHLRDAFQGYAVLQTEIMVTRILDIVTEDSTFEFVTRTVSAGLMFPTL